MRALALGLAVCLTGAAHAEKAPIDALAARPPPARAPPAGEPLRAAAEYATALAAFSAIFGGGVLVTSNSPIHIDSKGRVDAPVGSLVGAGALFVLSPFAAALGSYLVGRGSDGWEPSLGWASLGAYGTSLVAASTGLGLAAGNVDRGTAGVIDGALYFAVPLGAVLLQNAMKSPKE